MSKFNDLSFKINEAKTIDDLNKAEDEVNHCVLKCTLTDDELTLLNHYLDDNREELELKEALSTSCKQESTNQQLFKYSMLFFGVMVGILLVTQFWWGN